MLPKEISKLVPKNRLMTENEWRGIGVQQSQGWIHYLKHGPGKLPEVFSRLILFLEFTKEVCVLTQTLLNSTPALWTFRNFCCDSTRLTMASFSLEERGRLSITYGGREGGKWRECGERMSKADLSKV